MSCVGCGPSRGTCDRCARPCSKTHSKGDLYAGSRRVRTASAGGSPGRTASCYDIHDLLAVQTNCKHFPARRLRTSPHRECFPLQFMACEFRKQDIPEYTAGSGRVRTASAGPAVDRPSHLQSILRLTDGSHKILQRQPRQDRLKPRAHDAAAAAAAAAADPVQGGDSRAEGKPRRVGSATRPDVADLGEAAL